MRFLYVLSLFFLFSCSQSDLWKELNRNPDILPPVISIASPYDGETDVSVSKMSVKVKFSEQMKSSSVNEETFYIMDSFGSKIECVVSDFSGSFIFKASPVSDLSLNSTYTVFISKEVCDISGNKMKNDYSFSFTTAVTAPPEDTTSPQVTVKTGGAFLTSGKTISSSSVIIIEIIEKELSSKDYVTGNSVISAGKYSAQETVDLANDKLTITITPDPSLNLGNNLIFRITASDLSGNVFSTSITINVAAAASHKVYVNSSSGDDSNLGTDVYPVKSISAAINLLDKSDECFIYLTSGNYNESVAVSGFNNGITISGGWPNDFSMVNQFNSKSIISGSDSGISVSNCSDVKLSGLAVVTNVGTYNSGSVYSNITVAGTTSFEINCCDLQGINTSNSEYKDATALLINYIPNVKIINSKIRTNYERNKSYSDSGIFKGIEIKGYSAGSEVSVINSQVATGDSNYASGTSVYCLFYDGASSNDKVYIVNNTFDLRGGSVMQCVYFENSSDGAYYYDCNLALGRFSSPLNYVVLLSDPDMEIKSYGYNIRLDKFSENHNSAVFTNQGCSAISDSSNNYEAGFDLYSQFDYYPDGSMGLSGYNVFANCINGKPYQGLFPKDASNNYIDIKGNFRSTSGWWSIGAYHRD